MWYMMLRSATLLTLWIGRVGDNDGVVGNVVSVVNDDNVNAVDREATRVQRRSLDRVRTCTNLQQKLHSMLLTTDTSKSKGIWSPQLITSLRADQKPKYSSISGTFLVFSKQIWFLYKFIQRTSPVHQSAEIQKLKNRLTNILPVFSSSRSLSFKTPTSRFSTHTWFYQAHALTHTLACAHAWANTRSQARTHALRFTSLPHSPGSLTADNHYSFSDHKLSFWARRRKKDKQARPKNFHFHSETNEGAMGDWRERGEGERGSDRQWVIGQRERRGQRERTDGDMTDGKGQMERWQK